MEPVTINPKILGGMPVLTGTRIPVESVVYLNINLKKSPNIIATKYYTQVSVDQIISALKWFDKNERNHYGRLDI